MKETWKFNRVIGLFMSVFGIFQLCACGPSLIGEEIDESRTQIYFGLHQAGYGIAWFDAIKEGFEAKNPDIQLIPKPGTSAYEYNFKYNIGSMEEDIIFPGGGYDYASLVRENKILALDDVYQTEVAGKKLIDALMPNARNYLERNGHIYGMQGSDQFDILGITSVSGNVSLETASRNAAYVADLLGRSLYIAHIEKNMKKDTILV